MVAVGVVTLTTLVSLHASIEFGWPSEKVVYLAVFVTLGFGIALFVAGLLEHDRDRRQQYEAELAKPSGTKSRCRADSRVTRIGETLAT